ncbi:MAG: hypothetical protein A3B91_00915 [Candidatus Yanofskybacteria bacterium RIFCSPHIGHO2_02_FULL_41_29]|uniref:Bacterial surface antigen (D15) domain-containing protein n=1 Tax=Candidatus Yanofskybacteria bacterium RIFCSPHIGHO2_01_FULL_41_53 TaxID=1802663 RepID=A0A1F8EHX8_9BACT|nr:MAG: hypothetical protein A2650_02475 [Candidatus Yanofskybacteria bacterium RIFCSPHIGHO2_01_FULL_41_53]OGN11409.1 MAG: hypothetical protein A3B91_00915 [Candidatus Yanofskybacteria bacterium RIFCSPHIGHO2_02_FULL_41_29]OGN19150.1 MAG: hypothetical protein A3F48_01700 [Candidatus Yanofskybacteria bacterium RIFCSPHIGHO2_12_FULL_41_9]OGN21360.1 MAG: hypothetical protein A2916_03805 [Candidatus Yanofskybacteria bacterium RIFCSPLOWO2_01_FULL_41_67]OGN28851.1 MAG: hypothetical protein A3H54_01760 
MRIRLVALVLVLIAFTAYPAGAQQLGQFGKNNVLWNGKILNNFYESYHFDIWHDLDEKDPVQRENLRRTADILEGAYVWMSSAQVFNYNINKRIPILLYNTHGEMEQSGLVGGFMPEGIGAFVEDTRSRMVLKADFSKPLFRAIGVHELAHEFQIDIMKKGIISRLAGRPRVPNGYIEGFAEYVASLYSPHTRDDLRRGQERMAASNPKSLPTWYDLMTDAVSGYTMWKMVFEFIDENFGRQAAIYFGVTGLRYNHFGELVYDLSRGQLGNPDINSEKFDQKARAYWSKKFELDRIQRPNPYDQTDNFKGRSVTPFTHPYPILSAVPCSADGKTIAGFSIQKYGVALIAFDIPEETPYLNPQARDKIVKESRSKSAAFPKPKKPIRNLTPQLPPEPWEYLVVQGFETWPFNGSDVNCSRDGSRAVFFARKNRDHALVVVDTKTDKITSIIELPLDQAFSPFFSPDNEWIYFSAAENSVRNIYKVWINNSGPAEVVKITTDDRFSTAPAVSPDGSKIAYIGYDGDYQHLFLHDLVNGTTEQLTFGRFNDNSPSWSDDGTLLVYSSDYDDQIWNLYTMELATKTVSQWTNFFGQVDTPFFGKGSTTKAYYTVFRDDDQYVNQIYQNFEVFEIELLKPIRQFVSVNVNESNQFSFNPYKDLFRFDLDSNQMFNPKKPPEMWRLNTAQASFGGYSYYGFSNQAFFQWSNMLETKTHSALYASSGNFFRIMDYSYVNQEERFGKRWRGYSYRLPLYYFHFSLPEVYPAQPVLRSTLFEDKGLEFYSSYPKDKFNRIELFSRLRNRTYAVLGIDEEVIQNYPDDFNDRDLEMLRFFRNSNSSSLSFGAAYVRDTVLFSNGTQGPFHGNAFRAEVEIAPSISSSFKGFASVTFDGRTYRHIGQRVVFAGRGTVFSSSRANGDFVLMGGADMLRGITYGSLAGNQIAYASAELRFPLIDVVAFPGSVFFGPFRGLAFVDAGFTRFSDERFFGQKNKSFGLGFQYLPLNFVWSNVEGRWNRHLYITYNW